MPRYLDANYAGVLIIWDRLFGTFVPETKEEPIRYGIISQLGTFNPFRVAFHEWAGIWRDVRGAKSLREVLGYCSARPAGARTARAKPALRSRRRGRRGSRHRPRQTRAGEGAGGP